jgi:uncharacterized protein YggE
LKEKIMRKNIIFGLGFIFIATAFVVFVTSARAQTEGEQPTGTESPRTISVNGSGVVEVTPDIARITVGVYTENEDAQEAVASNNEQSDAMIAGLTDAGIAESDIRTTNYSIWPRNDFGPNGEIVGTTYVVDNSVQITVRDLDQIGDVLDAAVKSGANSIGGIQFDLSDREGAQQQAMVVAVDNARERAEVLAQAAGVEVGAVMTIQSYLGGGTPVPFEKSLAVADAAGMGSVPVAPGEMQIQVDVSVVYEIP